MEVIVGVVVVGIVVVGGFVFGFFLIGILLFLVFGKWVLNDDRKVVEDFLEFVLKV